MTRTIGTERFTIIRHESFTPTHIVPGATEYLVNGVVVTKEVFDAKVIAAKAALDDQQS